jgi:hypothetical protein
MDDEPSAARGVKRSRTAEVHNLSERVRIMALMHTYAKLLMICGLRFRGGVTGSTRRCAPCRSSSPTATRYDHNSVLCYLHSLLTSQQWTPRRTCVFVPQIDKASMLEEAIEYLKSLQLQVQMMSMGTAGGLCVPPAMLMQVAAHHHHPMAAPFPHLGMSLGFGMLPRFAQFPFPVMPPGAPMPPGAMFGMLPGQVMTSPFGHVNGAAPAEQRDPAPPAAAHPPVPVAVASQVYRRGSPNNNVVLRFVRGSCC